MAKRCATVPNATRLASTRAQLGEEEVELARQEGPAMSIEEAIEYALQES